MSYGRFYLSSQFGEEYSMLQRIEMNYKNQLIDIQHEKCKVINAILVHKLNNVINVNVNNFELTNKHLFVDCYNKILKYQERRIIILLTDEIKIVELLENIQQRKLFLENNSSNDVQKDIKEENFIKMMNEAVLPECKEWCITNPVMKEYTLFSFMNE